MPGPFQPKTTFETLESEVDRRRQQWVFERLPLTREQYQDLCCGLMNRRDEPALVQSMEDEKDVEDNTIIDLTIPEKSKKRKL
jgi:hypothetical protein